MRPVIAYPVAAMVALLAALGLSGCLDTAAGVSGPAVEATQTATYSEDDGAWTATYVPATFNSTSYITDANGVVQEAMSTLMEPAPGAVPRGPDELRVQRDPALTVSDRARAGDIALQVCLGQGKSISAEAMARSVFEAGSAAWIFQGICI